MGRAFIGDGIATRVSGSAGGTGVTTCAENNGLLAVVLGTGDFTLKFGQFALGGVGAATFGAILLYALLS